MSNRFYDSDIRITESGDIALDINNDIDTVANVDYVEQTILSRLRSAAKDWFYDKTGADIEWASSKLNNANTASTVVDNIVDALTKDKLCNEEDVYVQATPVDPVTLAVFVFVKTEFDAEPLGFNIAMNFLVGPTVRRI